jgi:hypothetical protein
MQKFDRNIGFWEKRQFFCRKLSKIAENCVHNIDPWGSRKCRPFPIAQNHFTYLEQQRTSIKHVLDKEHGAGPEKIFGAIRELKCNENVSKKISLITVA